MALELAQSGRRQLSHETIRVTFFEQEPWISLNATVQCLARCQEIQNTTKICDCQDLAPGPFTESFVLMLNILGFSFTFEPVEKLKYALGRFHRKESDMLMNLPWIDYNLSQVGNFHLNALVALPQKGADISANILAPFSDRLLLSFLISYGVILGTAIILAKTDHKLNARKALVRDKMPRTLITPMKLAWELLWSMLQAGNQATTTFGRVRGVLLSWQAVAYLFSSLFAISIYNALVVPKQLYFALNSLTDVVGQLQHGHAKLLITDRNWDLLLATATGSNMKHLIHHLASTNPPELLTNKNLDRAGSLLVSRPYIPHSYIYHRFRVKKYQYYIFISSHVYVKNLSLTNCHFQTIYLNQQLETRYFGTYINHRFRIKKYQYYFFISSHLYVKNFSLTHCHLQTIYLNQQLETRYFANMVRSPNISWIPTFNQYSGLWSSYLTTLDSRYMVKPSPKMKQQQGCTPEDDSTRNRELQRLPEPLNFWLLSHAFHALVFGHALGCFVFMFSKNSPIDE